MKCYGQITIKSIDDPITIILTNENHTFLGTVSGSAVPSSINTGIIAYKNADRIAVNIGTISTPNGISASIINNNSINTSITFNVTSALTASGTINIPITCDGRSFTKVFTYTLSIPQEGEAAKSVTITASSQVFQSNDAGKTFNPDSIKLTPLFQGGVSFLKWQYSVNGGTSWADVSSGSHGLSITSNVLTISKSSDLFTNTVTAIVFKCLSNIATYFDTMTIVKLYYDVSNIQDEIETIVKTEMSGVESRVDAVEKSIANEVWRNTMITVNDEEGNPIQKSIENLLVSQVTDMNGISMEVQDVKTNISNLEDTMEENVSQLELTTQGIKQMVESNYITTKDAEDMVSKSETSIINQTSDMIEQSVTDNITGANSYVNQKINQITQRVDDANGNISSVQQDIKGITQRIEDNEGNISTLQSTAQGLQSQIESAEGDISTIQQNAQNLQTQITDNKGNITQLQQNIEGFKTTVSSKFDDINSTIEQTAEDIELSVNEVSDNLKNNYYNKTETDALIKVESESITTSVKETISVEIDEIEVGGRNLWLNSTFNMGLDSYTLTTSSGTIEIDEGQYNGNNVLVLSRSGYSGSARCYSMTDNPPSISSYNEGENFILSAMVYVETELDADNNNIMIRGSAGDLPSITVPSSTPIGKWVKVISPVFTAKTAGTFNNCYILLGKNGVLKVSQVKLEIGNKATDWTPAPEDMATGEEVENAQNSANQAQSTADSTQSRVTIAESTIQQLSNAISSLIVDENGESMMTQTSDGWRFDMSLINSQLSNAANQLNDLAGDLGQIDQSINNLNNLANDLTAKTAYIIMTTDDSGAPCIELGKSDNPFKLRITNTSIDFMEGSTRVAYIDNQTLYIEKAVVKNEFQIGEGSGYIWQKRANNHLGLRWFEG